MPYSWVCARICFLLARGCRCVDVQEGTVSASRILR
jgi:hypothetical protein